MNHINRYVYFLAILTVLGQFTVSCVAAPETTPVQMQSTTQTMSPETATPFPQDTPTLSFNVDTSCWPVEPLRKGNDISGSLVVGRNTNEVHKNYIWDVSTFNSQPLNWDDDYASGRWNIMPKGDFLLSFPPKGNDSISLTLTSPNKTISTTLPQGFYLFMPLADGKILLTSGTNRNIKSENYKEGVGLTDVYYVFDPSTNKLSSSYTVFLPNFTPSYKDNFFINYSPDGRYVIYHSEQNGVTGYSLLDILLNKIKWTIPEPNYSVATDYFIDNSNIPIWKPDSSALFYAKRSSPEKVEDPDFYSISLDGMVSRFTDFKRVLLSEPYTIYSQPQWSSDLRYMITTVSASNKIQLLIWDDLNKTLFKPCLPSISYWPHWLFDDRHILISVPDIGTPTPAGVIRNTSQPMIVDLLNKKILVLPNNQEMHDYLKLSGEVDSWPYSVWGLGNWEIP